MNGRLIRLPSEKETERAKDKGYKPSFPAIGRFWQKDEKTYMSINHIPDVVFMLQEDKPKEERITEDMPF